MNPKCCGKKMRFIRGKYKCLKCGKKENFLDEEVKNE